MISLLWKDGCTQSEGGLTNTTANSTRLSCVADFMVAIFFGGKKERGRASAAQFLAILDFTKKRREEEVRREESSHLTRHHFHVGKNYDPMHADKCLSAYCTSSPRIITSKCLFRPFTMSKVFFVQMMRPTIALL